MGQTCRDIEGSLQSLLEYNPDVLFSWEGAGTSLNTNPAFSRIKLILGGNMKKGTTFVKMVGEQARPNPQEDPL
jgi:hypothetical protein